MEFKPDFLLVIPAFREQNRLPTYLQELVVALSSAAFATTILIVDDGSPKEEQLELAKHICPGTFGYCVVLEPLFLKSNSGKGHAILTGWSSGMPSKWLAFVDADGAIPAYEVRRVFSDCREHNNTICQFGTRIRMLGRKINRRLLRHLFGRIYATLVEKLINCGVYDTQCGFKIITASMFAAIKPRLQEPGLCFDIELLLALYSVGAEVLEVPIDWEDKPGGQINILKDGPKMLIELLIVLRRTKRWTNSDLFGHR